MDTNNLYPLLLFYLTPYNPRAVEVLKHPENAHLRSGNEHGDRKLGICLPTHNKFSTTVLTMGRGIDVDVYVDGSNIGKLQCSFEIDLDTGVIMFYDRSHSNTSQVFADEHARQIQFEYRRARKVVVRQDLNNLIGMGGSKCDLVMFKLEWHPNAANVIQNAVKFKALPRIRRQNLRVARTIDEAPTEAPSRYETRVQTPGPTKLPIRYEKIQPLGTGAFGEVHKAVDVDSGKVMAVKILKQSGAPSNAAGRHSTIKTSWKREIETLSQMNHPHIVNYIAAQNGQDDQVEIFMGLKHGTLESLIGNSDELDKDITNIVFNQMLMALDCIANKNIIHRDVKPENILYELDADNKYQFQLSDFGLCNRASDAVTRCGTWAYMAPEVEKGKPQSCKADVWSLFITMLWTMRMPKFCPPSFRSTEARNKAVQDSLSHHLVDQIKEMAYLEPEKRASAAQMLVKIYNGKGLSTPENKVPPLATNTVPVMPVLPAIRRLRNLPRYRQQSGVNNDAMDIDSDPRRLWVR